jgi:type I restriction enzyme S subunit
LSTPTFTSSIATIERMQLPDGWNWRRLGDIADINPRRPSLSRRDNEPTTFVPMSAVDERFGTIARSQEVPFGQVRHGYTYFAEGDVLFAKITPCMQNGKHAVARGLIGGFGFGTTEFHVIRPRPHVDSSWIHQFVRQPSVLRAAAGHFTGAVGQQRVPADFLEGLEIPIPPLDAQHRILAKLDQSIVAIERAWVAADERLQAARALPTALLGATFSSSEARGWPRVHLKDLLLSPLKTGISKPALVKSEKRCLTLSAVRNGELDLTENKAVDVTDVEAEGNWVNPGAFYVVRGNGNRSLVGRGALAPSPMPTQVLYPDLLIEVNADPARIDSQYLQLVWNVGEIRRDIEDRARTSAGIYKINQANLQEVALPVPPLPVQARIASVLREELAMIEAARVSLADTVSAVDNLRMALVRRAFIGAL